MYVSDSFDSDHWNCIPGLGIKKKMKSYMRRGRKEGKNERGTVSDLPGRLATFFYFSHHTCISYMTTNFCFKD